MAVGGNLQREEALAEALAVPESAGSWGVQGQQLWRKALLLPSAQEGEGPPQPSFSWDPDWCLAFVLSLLLSPLKQREPALCLSLLSGVSEQPFQLGSLSGARSLKAPRAFPIALRLRRASVSAWLGAGQERP